MISCLLCVDREDGLYAIAFATFPSEAERQFANKQRQSANDEGMWFTVTSLTGQRLTITSFPFKVCN